MNVIRCTSALAEVVFPGTDLLPARLTHGTTVETDASYRITVGTVEVKALRQ